jgi:hypothetical protein
VVNNAGKLNAMIDHSGIGAEDKARLALCDADLSALGFGRAMFLARAGATSSPENAAVLVHRGE